MTKKRAKYRNQATRIEILLQNFKICQKASHAQHLVIGYLKHSSQLSQSLLLRMAQNIGIRAKPEHKPQKSVKCIFDQLICIINREHISFRQIKISLINNFIIKTQQICQQYTDRQVVKYINILLLLTFYLVMSRKPNFKLNHVHAHEIKQMNESKQIDNADKQPAFNEKYKPQYDFSGLKNDKLHLSQDQNIQSQTPNRQKQQSQKQQSCPKIPNFLPRQVANTKQKFWTNQQTNIEKFPSSTSYNSGKWTDYRSDRLNQTQNTSPYTKFSTQSNFKSGEKSQVSQKQVKKKLFSQQDEGSPAFKLKESRINELAYTFKKKVNDYRPQFSSSSSLYDQVSQQKLNFQQISGPFDRDLPLYTNQNNPHQVNSQDKCYEELSSVKKKLRFEAIEFKQDNPIIEKINKQLRRQHQYDRRIQTDYKISRRNQSDSIKTKILESKSDLRRFYQKDSQNVQYQYRKAKFMDIFLGTKTIQHDIR